MSAARPPPPKPRGPPPPGAGVAPSLPGSVAIGHAPPPRKDAAHVAARRFDDGRQGHGKRCLGYCRARRRRRRPARAPRLPARRAGQGAAHRSSRGAPARRLKLRPNPPKPPGPPPAHLLRRPPPPSLQPRRRGRARRRNAAAGSRRRGLAGLAIATEGEQQVSWVQHWDEEVESFYYFNHATGEASWVRPSNNNFKPSPTAAAAQAELVAGPRSRDSPVMPRAE